MTSSVLAVARRHADHRHNDSCVLSNRSTMLSPLLQERRRGWATDGKGQVAAVKKLDAEVQAGQDFGGRRPRGTGCYNALRPVADPARCRLMPTPSPGQPACGAPTETETLPPPRSEASAGGTG